MDLQNMKKNQKQTEVKAKQEGTEHELECRIASSSKEYNQYQ